MKRFLLTAVASMMLLVSNGFSLSSPVDGCQFADGKSHSDLSWSISMVDQLDTNNDGYFTDDDMSGIVVMHMSGQYRMSSSDWVFFYKYLGWNNDEILKHNALEGGILICE